MSVVRLGSLSRLLREQVAPGTGLCLSCRRVLDRGGLLGSAHRYSSSAKPKDEVGAGDRCRLELVEVLQTRVQQLQADETSPLHEAEGKKLHPEQALGKGDANKKTVQTPKRWMEKLKNEQIAKHQKQKALNGVEGADMTPGKREADHAQGNLTKSVTKLQKNSAEKRPSKSRHLPDHKDTEVVGKAANQGNGLLLEDKDGNRYGGVQQTIHCYLETCIFLGELSRAQNCLQYYHQHISRRGLLNISMYNLLMRAWAKEASLSQIGRLFVLLGETALKPNLGSYAAVLEALGRTESNTKAIERCLKQMEENGMSAEDLFQGLPYVEDERDMVLKAIQRIKPDFTPPPKVQIVCSSPLVTDFYSKNLQECLQRQIHNKIHEPPPSYPKMGFTVSDLRQRFEEQLKIESCETVTINSVEAGKPVREERTKAREALDALRSGWRKDLLHAFRDSKNHLAEISRNSRRINLYPYLCLLEEQHYVDIMLQTLSKIPPTGESFLLLSQDLGSKVYNRFSIRRQLQGSHMDRIRYLYTEYSHLLAGDGQISCLLPRELWENLEHEKFGGSCSPRVHCLWPRSLVVQLGTHLVELMVQTIKLKNNMFSPRSEPKLIPVLYHMYSFRSTRQIGLIKPHPIYSQILLDAGETLLTFETAVMPMRCPPLPWTSSHFGAYLLSPAKLMRCNEGAVQHQLLLEKSAPGQLFPVLDSLNQLGICAWQINQPVLDIIVSIFNDKGSDKLDIPPPLSEAPALPVQKLGAQSSWEKLSYQKEQARCRKKAAEMFSLRMDALYKLSIANHLRDQIFWFPHNMDFRGRTYPCPPYFNHLGSDVTRALLLFAEGRPLGPNGLDWLKTHLINLTGLKKKSSLQERRQYADKIMDDILDSADRPLTGRKWWMEADEPWQTLACCIEVTNASRSPDPAKYISYFPVHQDGSCNGLQHYAALGRDEIGSRSVNLMPSETPQDVYSGVAQQVEEFRKIDANKGIKIAQVLEGFIGRKVVKQTVMTVVYGVTRYGGRLQIEKRLRELDSFPQEYVWEASHYLVQQVFSGLKEMFSGTRSIQHWLTESARMISKSGNTVEWVTPLGLPIIQPYHRSRSVMFQGNLQAVYMENKHDANERPDTMKQKNAFPPNFIHSLDSTHMMLTALHCHRRGLTYVSVHDCFWTHADTVDMMNKVCREQFVSLHSQPILQNLSQFLIHKYCHNAQSHNSEIRKMLNLFQDVPETGTFNLEHVKDSTYFFS